MKVPTKKCIPWITLSTCPPDPTPKKCLFWVLSPLQKLGVRRIIMKMPIIAPLASKPVQKHCSKGKCIPYAIFMYSSSPDDSAIEYWLFSAFKPSTNTNTKPSLSNRSHSGRKDMEASFFLCFFEELTERESSNILRRRWGREQRRCVEFSCYLSSAVPWHKGHLCAGVRLSRGSATCFFVNSFIGTQPHSSFMYCLSLLSHHNGTSE